MKPAQVRQWTLIFSRHDQPREGDGDCTGDDDEEGLLVHDDEVSDDDLADAIA